MIGRGEEEKEEGGSFRSWSVGACVIGRSEELEGRADKVQSVILRLRTSALHLARAVRRGSTSKRKRFKEMWRNVGRDRSVPMRSS
jgi:hypothetical protein